MAIINFNSISGVSTISATTSITVGDTVIRATSIGIGTTTTTGRNAGVGTATGTLIFNSTIGVAQVYAGSTNGWVNFGDNTIFSASGGTTIESGGSKYHIFTTGPSSLVVSGGTVSAEILVMVS